MPPLLVFFQKFFFQEYRRVAESKEPRDPVPNFFDIHMPLMSFSHRKSQYLNYYCAVLTPLKAYYIFNIILWHLCLF